MVEHLTNIPYKVFLGMLLHKYESSDFTSMRFDQFFILDFQLVHENSPCLIHEIKKFFIVIVIYFFRWLSIS